MPEAQVEMFPGQSVNLNAVFSLNGQPGPAVAPGPVTWAHNANMLPQPVLASLTVSQDTMSAVLYISGASTGSGTFNVTANSGALTDNQIINCMVPPANVLTIVPGPVGNGPAPMPPMPAVEPEG